MNNSCNLRNLLLQEDQDKGVEAWDKWRKEHPKEIPHLKNENLSHRFFLGVNFREVSFFGSNLSHSYCTGADCIQADFSTAILENIDLNGAKLDEANFYQTNLTKAALAGANLKEASLKEATLDKATLQQANLTQADLYGASFKNANLSNANLKAIQARGTDFEGATLTGACIEDWNINSATNLNNVICDYIYLKADQQERRPSDPNQNFAPGDFSRLFQKALETVDLIFRNGIDWQAFATSLKTLRAEQLKIEGNNQLFTIRAIETRDDGTFVVRINVPPQVDKAEIEASFKRKYQKALKATEQFYRRELQAKDDQIAIYRQHNASLERILDTLASRPIEINNNNMTNSESKGDILSGNFGIGKMTGGEIKNGAKVAGILNETQPEIIQLIELLRRNIQTLNEPTIRDEAIEYLNDLETEVKQPEPKKSRIKAALLALWNIGKDLLSRLMGSLP